MVRATGLCVIFYYILLKVDIIRRFLLTPSCYESDLVLSIKLTALSITAIGIGIVFGALVSELIDRISSFLKQWKKIKRKG